MLLGRSAYFRKGRCLFNDRQAQLVNPFAPTRKWGRFWTSNMYPHHLLNTVTRATRSSPLEERLLISVPSLLVKPWPHLRLSSSLGQRAFTHDYTPPSESISVCRVHIYTGHGGHLRVWFHSFILVHARSAVSHGDNATRWSTVSAQVEGELRWTLAVNSSLSFAVSQFCLRWISSIMLVPVLAALIWTHSPRFTPWVISRIFLAHGLK